MLTLREVLELDAVRRGEPRVVAGFTGLDTPVRWVHAAELPDVGRLLRGGELLLSTGIALPSSPAELAGYVSSLADAGVAGLAIELGRRFFGSLPRVLQDAAMGRGLPLVEFHREVPFVEITEAVHARIIDELLIERAAATLALGRLLTRQPESVERQAHRALISAIIELPAASAGTAAVEAEATAQARARAMGVPLTGRKLVALVLRLPDETDGAPERARAAEAAADGAGPRRRRNAPLRNAPLRDGRPGIPDRDPAVVLQVAEAAAGVCRSVHVPALVGALDDLRVGAILSLASDTHTGTDTDADTDRLLTAVATRLTARLDAQPRLAIGVGTAADSLRSVRDGLVEARAVADIAIRYPRPGSADRGGADQGSADRGGATPGGGWREPGPAGPRPYYRLADLRLRGLVRVLRDDPRLAAFADRELGPLLAHDAEHGTSLVADLAAFIDAGGNKALAAQRAHLARPTFYQRLRLIERVLGVSLADPESRAALHVALLTQTI